MTPARNYTKKPQWQIIYSSKVGEKIIVARDDNTASALKASRKHGEYIIYTEAETEMLKGQPIESIKFLHKVKKMFNGTIVSITPDPGNAKDNHSCTQPT